MSEIYSYVFDRATLDGFFRSHARKLFRLARQLAPESADDLVQKAFLAAAETLEQRRRIEHPMAFCCHVMRCRARDAWRHESAARRSGRSQEFATVVAQADGDALDEECQNERTPCDVYLEKESQELLKTALLSLPIRQREAVELHLKEEPLNERQTKSLSRGKAYLRVVFEHFEESLPPKGSGKS